MVTEKLNEYIVSKGISMYAFENSLGVSRGSISKAIKENKSIGSQVVENILITYSDINPDWLLIGRGSMLRSDVDNKKNELSAVGCTTSATLTSPTDESFIYKMYKEEKAENKVLIEEIGGLKERIRQLEASRSISQDKRQSDEIALAFPSDSLEGCTKDSLPMRKPITSSEKSSAAKT